MKAALVISDRGQRRHRARAARARPRARRSGASITVARGDSARPQGRDRRDCRRRARSSSTAARSDWPRRHRRRARTCTRTTSRAPRPRRSGRADAGCRAATRRAARRSNGLDRTPMRNRGAGVTSSRLRGLPPRRRPRRRAQPPARRADGDLRRRWSPSAIAAAVAPVGDRAAASRRLRPARARTCASRTTRWRRIARHPNVGAVLVVALGCEQVIAQHLAEAARQAGKPAEIIAIQSEGGTVRTTETGDRDRAEPGGRCSRPTPSAAVRRRR